MNTPPLPPELRAHPGAWIETTPASAWCAALLSIEIGIWFGTRRIETLAGARAGITVLTSCSYKTSGHSVNFQRWPRSSAVQDREPWLAGRHLWAGLCLAIVLFIERQLFPCLQFRLGWRFHLTCKNRGSVKIVNALPDSGARASPDHKLHCGVILFLANNSENHDA